MSNERDNQQQQPPLTTTDAGVPAPSDEYSLTVGPTGPGLLQDNYLIEKMAQFNREGVPERVVHAKGTGPVGYFTVTADETGRTRGAVSTKVENDPPIRLGLST